MQPRRARRNCAVACLTVLGLLLLITGMLLVTWLPRLLRSKIAESIIISSPQHPAYVDQFLTNWPQHEDQEHQVPLKYNKFTFYHLENRDAFLDGARPIFSPRGPFVFREFYRHQNVSFSADGSQVSYADSIINRFVPELSNGSLADRITLLNLPYIKIASRYGRTESQLLESLAVLAVPKIIKRLEEQMVPSIKAAASAKAIQRAIRTFWPLNGLTVDGLLSRMGGDCPLSANQCSVIRVPATKYRVLVDTRVCGEASMGEKCRAEGKSISLPQMKALFNSSDPLSLLSGDDGAVIWLTTNQQQHNRLSAHFNISLSQVSLLHLWMKRVADSELVSDGVFKIVNNNFREKKFPVTNWRQLVLRQWLWADVIAALKKLPAPLSVQPTAPPEFIFSISGSDAATTMPQWNAEMVECIVDNLTANKSLVLSEFLGLQGDKRPDFLREDLDQYQAKQSLAQCLPSYVEVDRRALINYFNYGSRSFSLDIVRQSISAGSGILMERTVRDHVLGAEEPLLRRLLDESDPRFHAYSLLPNDHSLDLPHDCHSSADLENDYTSCRLIRQSATANGKVTISKQYIRSPSTFYTGVGNISRLGQLVAFNEMRQISRVFAHGPLAIDGAANDLPDSVQYGFSIGQSFPPFNQIGQAVYIFIPAIMAPLRFTRSHKVHDLHGLALTRFILRKKENFSPARSGWSSPSLSASISSGEYLSLREPKQLPIYVSMPSESEESDSSYVDIEPTTGKTMRLRIRLEISTSTNHTDFDVFYPHLYKADHLPVFCKEVEGIIDKHSAERFKSTVYTVQYFIDYGSVVAVVLGSLMLNAAAVMLLSTVTLAKSKYLPLNVECNK